MVDISSMCYQECLEQLVDFAIRQSIDVILYYLDDMDLDARLHLANVLLSLIEDIDG